MLTPERSASVNSRASWPGWSPMSTPTVRYRTVGVLIGDQPGQLARLFTDADRSGVNIEDVRLEHSAGQLAGLVHLSVDQRSTTVLEEALRANGWRVQ